jgi:hypothetical protein
MNETQSTPYPSESPEKWARLRKLAEAGDEKKTRDALSEMDLSPKLAKLFITAAAEDAELAEIEKAGEAAGPALQEAMTFLRALVNVKEPSSVEEALKRDSERRKYAAQAGAAEQAVSAAAGASGHRRWLRLWLAEQFGETPPTRGGIFGSSQPSPRTVQAAAAVGIEQHYAISPWRKVGQREEDTTQPRRRYTSFSPVAPRKT